MIQLMVGSRGSGKTKQLVEMINNSVQNNKGSIVCIEKGMKLTYDLDHHCRLIDMEEYKIEGYPMLHGFVAGILAGNYDINEIYVDGILKIGERDLEGLGELLEDLAGLTGDGIKFIITVSCDEADLPDSVKKFL